MADLLSHLADLYTITYAGLELATAAVTEGQLDVLKHPLLETMLTLHDMYAGRLVPSGGYFYNNI